MGLKEAIEQVKEGSTIKEAAEGCLNELTGSWFKVGEQANFIYTKLDRTGSSTTLRPKREILKQVAAKMGIKISDVTTALMVYNALDPVDAEGSVTKKAPAFKESVSEASAGPSLETANTAAALFGWSAKEGPKGIELRNRKGKHVVNIVVKGAKYVMYDTGDFKLMSGRGQLGKSIEKLIAQYYYGQRV